MIAIFRFTCVWSADRGYGCFEKYDKIESDKYRKTGAEYLLRKRHYRHDPMLPSQHNVLTIDKLRHTRSSDKVK